MEVGGWINCLQLRWWSWTQGLAMKFTLLPTTVHASQQDRELDEERGGGQRQSNFLLSSFILEQLYFTLWPFQETYSSSCHFRVLCCKAGWKAKHPITPSLSFIPAFNVFHLEFRWRCTHTHTHTHTHEYTHHTHTHTRIYTYNSLEVSVRKKFYPLVN